MSFQFPSVYPITDTSISGLSHFEQVKRLVDGGAEIIQLREKKASSKVFFETAKEVIEYARPKDVKIIINDRVDIAFALKADGVHLGQDDLPPSEARRLLGEKAIIGFSTHTIEQAIEAANSPIDYLAIGPIYTTSTKENPDSVVGIEGLREVRSAIGDFTLVAIGGIDHSKASEVFENGADSIACISSILLPNDKIEENLCGFVDLYKKFKNS